MEEEGVSVTLQRYYNNEQDALRRMACWRRKARRLQRWLAAVGAVAAVLAVYIVLRL